MPSFDARPRVNQPTGFASATRMQPKRYCGRRHNYVFYPVAWVDADTGTRYEQGYYDENGQRYDAVAFEQDGRYQNVVCHCPYCGQDSVLDLGAGEAEAQALKCPHCGGPMEIRSELDSILREVPENTHVYDAEASLKNAFPQKKKKPYGILVLLVLLVFGLWNRLQPRVSPEPEVYPISITENSGSAISLGSTVYLEKQADGYHVINDVLRADKILNFDYDADSYYDEDSDCWLWYNTDMRPAIWQYWYEGISSDFGDYGWMEHDAEGWFIEASAGNWIPLPAKYKADALWYIA